MSVVPPPDVVTAIEAGMTNVTRRVEIFEADGVTPWYANGSEEDLFRLTDGSVSIDSSRDERRALDITLDNDDNKLRPGPEGFWYDKVIRPYRGVRYTALKSPPKILIIEDSLDLTGAFQIRSLLMQLGFPNVDIKLDAATVTDLFGYKIVMSVTRGAQSAKASLLNSAYAAGYNIFTWEWAEDDYGFGGTTFALSSTDGAISITPAPRDTPVAGGWSTESEGTYPVGAPALARRGALTSPAIGVSTSLNATYTHYTGIVKDNGIGKWFTYRAPDTGAEAKALWRRALDWMWAYQPYQEWETPLGEFVLDTINTKNFPKTLSASARDKTKICLGSKIEKNMSFEVGTSVNELITALAANAGITKINLDSTNDGVLSKRMDIARGTERWSVMKDAAAYLNRQIFFDVDGYLIHQQYADPTLGSPAMGFATSRNLVDYDRSTSDARIYNHIIVTGSNGQTDELAVEYFGEAINNNPASPTSIQRMKQDRSYFYTSAFFTSNTQCQTYANTLLLQTAYEQYEMNWSSLVYPWLDSGVVVDLVEPDQASFDPTRFLMDQLTIPLGLTAMDVTGKRVLFVEALDSEEVA